MSRPVLRLLVGLAAICGAALGALATLVLMTPAGPVTPDVAAARDHGPEAATPGGHSSAPAERPAPASAAPTVPAASPAASETPSAAAERTLLVWTAGGLPPSVPRAADRDPAISRWSAVSGDQAGLVAVHGPEGEEVLTLTDGWQIPVDVLAVDPARHAPFAGDLGGPGAEDAVADLEAGEAVLSATSAALRGVGAGAVLTMAGGAQLRVSDVIDDRAASGAEVVVHAGDAPGLAVDTARFLLLSHSGPRAAVQQRIAEVVGLTPIRFRTPAETTWLRHGDAVLPQVLLKEAFGEFPIMAVAGRDVVVDPAWEAAHIVTEEVAILGRVRCHRRLLPRLAGAMEELARRNLAHLIDVEAFAGCYVPRRIAAGEALSRHAWGVAVDLNVGDNPRGSFSTQDPRLVEVMRAHGFTWGGTWLVPDPAHHEVVTTEDW